MKPSTSNSSVRVVEFWDEQIEFGLSTRADGTGLKYKVMTIGTLGYIPFRLVSTAFTSVVIFFMADFESLHVAELILMPSRATRLIAQPSKLTSFAPTVRVTMFGFKLSGLAAPISVPVPVPPTVEWLPLQMEFPAHAPLIEKLSTFQP